MGAKGLAVVSKLLEGRPNRMPVLDWIGKQAVVNHHLEVPYRLLQGEAELSVGESGRGNLLVEGDNLEALKALLPYYAGQVKCIYIDPPYNTGNEKWVYNDNVNSPEIRRWLEKVVGGQAEDLSRHDKWLCMMYPRLRLLREFLQEDGAIFISIDDNEVSHLRCIMDEVFGSANFVATVIWEKVFSPKSTAKHLSESHDYIVVYAKSAEKWRPNLVPRGEAQDARYRNVDDDPRGPWTSGDLSARNYYSLGRYPITCPSGRVIEGPPPGTYWRVSRETFDELNADNRIWWGKNGNNVPRLKRFLSQVKEGMVPVTIWPHREVGNTQEAKKEVVGLIGDDQEVFITPKPSRLVKRVLQLATDPDSLVMDSFAGSGTTGQAVVDLNREDGGSRQFILVELEPGIAQGVTRERLRRTVEDGETGGFRYCRLGATLFGESGRISPEVRFPDLARHIYFTETREPLLGEVAGDDPLIGVSGGVGYYLLYNGVLKDKRINGGNILTGPLLESLPAHEGPKVIYGLGCRLGAERLREADVTFKQIPYQVKGG